MRNDWKMESIRLLCDGKEAFPFLLSCMANAKRSILINMFIWRNDIIGKQLAHAVLEAADRGVHITIQKDRYGITCEYCEEDCTSMFHEMPDAEELAAIRTLSGLYHPDRFGKERMREGNELRDRMRNHPNITVHPDVSRYDHSKYYIFDDELMVFGGINIEDKENGADREGRIYRDFMVALEGKEWVDAFYERVNGSLSKETEWFGMNRKTPVRFFEMKERYVKLIDEAERELTILMAYFAPVPEIMGALCAAAKRGVSIRLLIPAHANFTNDLNRRTMTILYDFARKTNTDIRIYLSDDMTHTKMLMSESCISVGSCNINKKAFEQLDELNFFAPDDDSAFASAMRKRTEEIIASAHLVTARSQLSYHHVMSVMERLVM